MNQKVNQEQLLSTIQADHKIIAYGVDSFNRLLNGERSADIAEQFAEVQRLLREKLAPHFAYEEEKVFMALLADSPPVRTIHHIAELRQEHARLLERAQEVTALLRGHDVTTGTNELWTIAVNFLIDLEKHAAKEDQLLELIPSAN